MQERLATRTPVHTSDEGLSVTDQLASLHSMRTQMEFEREENERLVQIYRIQNEAIETKFAVACDQLASTETCLNEARE